MWPDRRDVGGVRQPAMPRRRLLRAISAAATLAVATPALASVSVTELALLCDLTLGPAMRAASTAYATATGTRVSVFPTAPGLILPQLQRSVQNDIVVTSAVSLQTAAQTGIIASGAARGSWRNRLVVAAKRGAPPVQAKPIAVVDPSSVSDMDGAAILARLGLPSDALLGVIDTDTVAALVLDGTARAGLLHMTDLRAHAELEPIRVVPDDVQPPFVYAASVTNLARRPDPTSFLEFLTSSRAAALLTEHGLETNA